MNYINKKNILIKDLKTLNINDVFFKKDEERIINELRVLFKESPDVFTEKDVKDIKLIDNLKDLAEDIEYCKSRESIELLIADFQGLMGNDEDDHYLDLRLKTFIKLCQEKKQSLPSEKKVKEKHNQIQNFGSSPNCIRCKKLMILRESSYGYFWGCIDFPICRGIKKANVKKNY